MTDLIDDFLRQFTVFWATIDPISTLGLFLAITPAKSAREKRSIAMRATLYSAIILLGFVMVGQIILTYMEIRLQSFQIAGGILLFLFGVQMVFGDAAPPPDQKPEAGHDVAVFPLAIPSIASPGAIMAAVLMFEQLRAMPEVEVAPIPWLHISWVRVGFLMSTDIMWSQVETFYVNAAPRLRRVEPFTLKLGGISVVDGERIYLGADDGGTYREARKHAKLGVPKVGEVLKNDPLITPEGDRYMPRVEFGFFTGRGSRERVIEALEPYRDLVVGEIPLTHLKMARLPIQPHSHFEDLDVVAEIPMLGAAHRGGYHN